MDETINYKCDNDPFCNGKAIIFLNRRDIFEKYCACCYLPIIDMDYLVNQEEWVILQVLLT